MAARLVSVGTDPSRSLVLDILHFARRVPRYSVDRVFGLRQLDALRQAASMRISWPVLFCRAYALVAADIPELRWCYIPWPIPRVVEFEGSVAAVPVNRVWRGRNRLFWAMLRDLESVSLAGLQRQLDHYRHAPLEEAFRRQLLFSRFPVWLRRPIWWLRLHGDSRRRARRLGTFSLSVLAGQLAYNRNFPHFHTCGLTYGPLQPDGSALVTLICDHRILDGMTAALALQKLEQTLTGPIAAELAQLARVRRAA